MPFLKQPEPHGCWAVSAVAHDGHSMIDLAKNPRQAYVVGTRWINARKTKIGHR
jgi:hypothetical protein